MTISTIGIISSSLRRGGDASRAFVRAAFITSSQNSISSSSTSINGRRRAFATPSVSSSSRNFNTFNLNTISTSRCMSSTASTTDEELDSALDEILGDALGTEEDAAVSTTNELESEINDLLNEALSEAENPAVDDEVSGRGHIEGSHPFPKELVEEQVSSYFVICTLKCYYYMSMLFSLTFICMFVV